MHTNTHTHYSNTTHYSTHPRSMRAGMGVQQAPETCVWFPHQISLFSEVRNLTFFFFCEVMNTHKHKHTCLYLKMFWSNFCSLQICTSNLVILELRECFNTEIVHSCFYSVHIENNIPDGKPYLPFVRSTSDALCTEFV